MRSGPGAATSQRNNGTASVLVAALEAAWAAIVAAHPDVPPAVIVVAAGSGGRANELTLGHFAAGRWDVGGDRRAEVLVGGEGLQRGPTEVLGTLLHEAAHGIGSARGVRNTSRGGRYHNRLFRQLAIEVGLDVAQDGARGWSATKMSPAATVRHAQVLERLEPALVMWRRSEQAGAATTSRNPKPCQCDCGRRIRVAPSTLEQGPIVCGLCHVAFSAEA